MTVRKNTTTSTNPAPKFATEELNKEYNDAVSNLNKRLGEKEQLRDVLPEGWDSFKIKHDHNLKFRNSLYELPMNETHYPDGTINSMYDNRWYYCWAADTPNSVGTLKAVGYTLVLDSDMEALIEEGKMPEMYRSLLEKHEGALRFGTEILMRIPRLVRKETVLRQKQDIAETALKSIDRKTQANLGSEARVPEGANSINFDT